MKEPTLEQAIAVLNDILEEDIPGWDLDPGFYGVVCKDPELSELDSDESNEFAQAAVRLVIETLKNLTMK